MNKTIEYYNSNAKEYFDSTVNADMSAIYDRFLKYLPENAYVLDAGCGSGRDSMFFLKHGFRVKAIDGSKEMCDLASEYLGDYVENISFNEIEFENEFDAIWASASLLHVNRRDLPDVINKLKRSLKKNGILYASFKYGENDRIRGERYFNDLNEESVKEYFKDFDIKEIWFNDDVRPGRSEKWINLICINL